MKKFYLFLFLSIFAVTDFFAFSFYGEYEIDPGHNMILNEDGTGKIYDSSTREETASFNFKREKKGNLYFIHFLNEGVMYDDDIIHDVVLLYGKEIHDDYERNIALGYYGLRSFFIVDIPRWMDGYCTYKDCTSYLTEGNKEYTIDNLSEIRIDSPWVEGVTGNGEGEGFTIVGNKPYLLLVNGFISINKPYLYNQNSRVKELRITGSVSGKTKVVEFLDTPNPQTADISFLDKNDDTIVRIVSVYPGTKYQDTCISLCRLAKDEIVPYLGEDSELK